MKNREWYGDVTDNCGEIVLHLSNVYNLPQLVDFPTHIYSGQLNSALDLVLSDVPGMQASVLPPLGSSDQSLSKAAGQSHVRFQNHS